MEIVDVPEQLLAVVRGAVPMAELPGFFDAAFAELGDLIATGALVPVGPPLARYPSMPGALVQVEAGFPVAAAEPTGRVEPEVLRACRAAHTVHHGPYEGLAGAWEALMAWSEAQGLTASGPFWEVYVTDPTQTEPVTELYQPIAPA